MNYQSGVYVLYAGDIPLYVGSAIMMGFRVREHKYMHRIPFDRVEFHAFPEKVIRSEEQRFMDELRPLLNKKRAVRIRREKTVRVFEKIPE